jgi:hypothetical protein
MTRYENDSETPAAVLAAVVFYSAFFWIVLCWIGGIRPGLSAAISLVLAVMIVVFDVFSKERHAEVVKRLSAIEDAINGKGR